MTFSEFMGAWLSVYRTNGGEEKFEEPLSIAALDAWNNRQSLIDAHNKRCEEICERRIGKRQGCNVEDKSSGFMCAECPRRYLITD